MARGRNLARMTTATTGTGTVTLGSAVSGSNSFAGAGFADGETVTYSIFDITNSASETGRGTYTSSGTTLSRDTVESSTNGGSKISLSGNAEVAAVMSAKDFEIETNAQTGTSYTVLQSDFAKLITLTNASSIAVTLPQATSKFSAGWYARLRNIGSSVVTITPTTSTINGLTSLALGPSDSVVVVSDGTNWQLAYWSRSRERLAAARTYYVRTDGSNSNNGLANTSGGAFATIQKAWDTICTLDLAGFDATIKLGNTGTFSTVLFADKSPVGGRIIIEGDTSTPSNTLVSTTSGSAALRFVVGCRVKVQYFKITTATSGGHILLEAGAADLEIGSGMEFGAATAGFTQLTATAGKLSGFANYTISGGAAVHVAAGSGGFVDIGFNTVTLSGTPAFTTAFASVDGAANLWYRGATFSGSATGPRYAAYENGIIRTSGGGASYFPGNSAGATGTGGIYS